MDYLEFERFLKDLPQIKALVVGDLMLDEYLWCDTERISPEAPVPVVDVRREDHRLGGAGNVINNLRTLGVQTVVASALGDDADGVRLCSMLEDLEISSSGLVSVPGRTTARKTRILASNQQVLRVDRESREWLQPDFEQILIEYIRQNVANINVILVSDYEKGVLSESLLEETIRLGRENNIPVIVDPKGDDYRKYSGATLVTPNRKEAQAASHMSIVDEASLDNAGKQLREKLDLDALVITRSEEGMSLFTRDGQHVCLPTRAREVFDVSGAGDTVMTMFGLALASGLSMREAAEAANVAAGIVVGKVGTSTVSTQEILAEISLRETDTDRKIVSRKALVRLLEQHRTDKRSIVFTNGCFDLLHVGHVKYLQAARQLGDLLVLGLNSDDSIRRLKGDNRPLIEQDERAHILAALHCIDYIVIFDEDTPLELIETLRPDILVKGGDYTPDGVVGRDLVESYGGRVELIQFVDGKSTTGIIEKILQQYGEA
jgi:D-beta-D-heptose 7-phosphate kinase/D-beta-D-heptose 1-phosphate adenosyltransferase